ncbi:ATP-binding cassette domain-containing protein [Amycolatopsis aidingensis]|uniref:ATP-binding cassette domain-containing protein n=1 Tax=Amycolatopsis aidingensis TaxID=2842453 RepID=UPI001C0D537D|nr:ATP-binding cassette domain-containing protein [Amycolatopsis aidingensis]
MTEQHMIEVDDLRMEFGEVTALDGVSLAVPKGTTLGLLGHNGAGKTTLVNVLSTLLPPTSGTARVCGLDVTSRGREVRKRIGLTGQFAAVDDELPGRDNLILLARLLGAGRRQARARADELLELFDLTEAAGRLAKKYSGGMRRRLDVAASLVGSPDVVFLDEPTTGLDPSGRKAVWDIVTKLTQNGSTILLTTQYLEEADQLADAITVLSKGRIVADGTAAELKSAIGNRTVTVTLHSAEDAPKVLDGLGRAGLRPVHVDDRNAVTTPVSDSTDLAVVVRALDEVGVTVAGLAFAEPSLDDVYLALTDEVTAPVLPEPAAATAG